MKNILALTLVLLGANLQAESLSVTEISFQEYGPNPVHLSFSITSEGDVKSSRDPDDLCISSMPLDEEMATLTNSLPNDVVASYSAIAFSDDDCSHINEYIVSVRTVEFGTFLFRWPTRLEGCGFNREVPDWVKQIEEVVLALEPRIADLCSGDGAE